MFLLRSCPTSFRNGSRPTWAVCIVTSNHECSSSHPCSLQKLTQWWIWSVTEMQAFWFVVLCLFQSSSDWSFCLWSWRRSVWALIRLLLVSAVLRHLLCLPCLRRPWYCFFLGMPERFPGFRLIVALSQSGTLHPDCLRLSDLCWLPGYFKA